MAIIKVKTGGITADAVTDALIADDVVGTEHLTANEVDTAALKADAVTGAELADNAVNSEHYTDGSIDTAHIADAQITTAKLATAVFTGATDIGAAIVDADLFLMDDGAGGTIRKTTASRIKTYAGGGTNTPAFQVKINTEQTPNDNATTKVNFDTEDFDTASAYDTSNKRFVVPSGQGGKYFFYSSTCVGSNTNASYKQSYLYIYKNNSAVNTAHINTNDDGNGRYTQMVVTSVLDLNASDYIEIFAKIDVASGGCEIRTAESVFGGYKIIE